MPESSTAQPVYLGDHRVLTRTAHGHVIFVDTRDLRTGPQLLLDGTAYASPAASLRRFVRPGMTVLEAGSGFGELTLLSGELVGESGRIIALEPDEGRALLLADSLTANGLSDRTSVETGGTTAADLDGYLAEHGLSPDVLIVSAEEDPHALIAGALGFISRAADIRILLTASLNGEAKLLEAAGLVALESCDGATVYGPPEALPQPVPVTTVAAFAEEIFQSPDIIAHFFQAYAGTPATLAVVGPGWEQGELERRLESVIGAVHVQQGDLEVVAVAAPEGGSIEEEIAAIVSVVLSRGAVPPAFRFIMRSEPPAPATRRLGLLGPDAEGPELPLYEEQPGLLRSRLCSQEQMETEDYARWCSEFGQLPALYRKQWEWAFIVRALHERGKLAPGRRGIGFGVGTEPLPATFARLGAAIVATDLDFAEAASAGWLNANQHANSLASLNKLGLCPADQFAKLVSFRVEDMNNISPELHGGFDFTWSSCCFEHLGSIEHGLRFVEESIKLLKPGGVAVHTTEFNLSSNHDTAFEGGCVLFRRRDIDRLAQRLTAAGHKICIDYTEGTGPADQFVDVPPYADRPHLRLLLEGFVSTSIGLIVQRGD